MLYIPGPFLQTQNYEVSMPPPPFFISKISTCYIATINSMVFILPSTSPYEIAMMTLVWTSFNYKIPTCYMYYN